MPGAREPETIRWDGSSERTWRNHLPRSRPPEAPRPERARCILQPHSFVCPHRTVFFDCSPYHRLLVPIFSPPLASLPSPQVMGRIKERSKMMFWKKVRKETLVALPSSKHFTLSPLSTIHRA